ncbi:hypothetical protein BDQ12DRAFT_773474 [Crucibulum laeve]|uniref:Uncharacterized protein n=1 Tax=Crucibulum laeve TaxID=68775 RepID=A0A5C3LI11_9AGAR|nr:hypothetical protein BDQ12DRAFT_773474 [Crucibulum laeve]
MADTKNATVQNATTQIATAQTDPPQIMNNTMLYAVLNTIEILKLLKITKTLAPDPMLVISVDDNMVYTSKKLKKKIIPVKLEINREICFKTSSTIEIKCICSSRNLLTRKKHILGVYHGKILDLISKDVKCDLRNSAEVVTVLALTFSSSSVDDIIKKIEISTSGLDHKNIKSVSGFIDTGSSLAVPLGQALDVIANLTKKLSDVHPILSISCSVLLSVYQTIKAQTKQDENVQKLVEALKDMFLSCQNCHDLPEFSKPGNAIEKMAILTVEIGVLLEKYNHACFIARALKSVMPQEMLIQVEELYVRVLETKNNFQLQINIGTRNTVEKVYEINETEKQSLWFLNGEKYKEWKKKVDSFLWISGKLQQLFKIFKTM